MKLSDLLAPRATSYTARFGDVRDASGLGRALAAAAAHVAAGGRPRAFAWPDHDLPGIRVSHGRSPGAARR